MLVTNLLKQVVCFKGGVCCFVLIIHWVTDYCLLLAQLPVSAARRGGCWWWPSISLHQLYVSYLGYIQPASISCSFHKTAIFLSHRVRQLGRSLMYISTKSHLLPNDPCLFTVERGKRKIYTYSFIVALFSNQSSPQTTYLTCEHLFPLWILALYIKKREREREINSVFQSQSDLKHTNLHAWC